jgi:hypothetical protein
MQGNGRRRKRTGTDPSGDAMPESREIPEPILQFFEYAHLDEHRAEVSAWFADVAQKVMSLPRNAERSTCLRKLLEAKDCGVRARLARTPDRGQERGGS